MSDPPPAIVAPTQPATETTQPPARPNPGRLPSLNELAARINANNTNASGASSQPISTSTSSSRPRLAAGLLRTGSSISVNTVDSTAVNPPTTRSVSPALSTSPPRSNTSTPAPSIPGGDADITSEKLEQLNLNEEAKAKEGDATTPAAITTHAPILGKKAPRGYKNIPSLDAITERWKKTRALSIDGSGMPSPGGSGLPGIEELDKAMEEAIANQKRKNEEHPLQHPWTIYHDSKARPPPGSSGPPDPTQPYTPTTTDTGVYEAGLTVVGEFDTVESFCRYFNWLKPPSMLEKQSNYHLFKEKIKPMWEDDANTDGGKWVLTMKNNPALLDRSWQWLAMALVGEELDEGDEICGAVVSVRNKMDRIQVWTRSKSDIEKLNGIGKKLVKLLDVSEADNIGLEFQYHSEDHPPPNKFISIQASFPQSGFRPTFPAHGSSHPGQHGPDPSQSPVDGATGAGGGWGAPPGHGGAFGGFMGGAFGSRRGRGR
ncbi:translation initiation factor eIF4e [Sistotremastrum suecicum HHB10207 ss-3]|uniref:Translation initiation factor eIF4e n=1 Tax=Sistotremastrum suecicum HHB10207 ss-3 TaxID=1314776 RepID=A0A166GD16_9AGAM|nr:translation initiation factor eIF4e [Sistotremastrum suecicum HHB10207 ss-3]